MKLDNVYDIRGGRGADWRASTPDVLRAAPAPRPRSISGPLPSWAAGVFVTLSLGMLPWMIYLGTSLPSRATTTHNRIAWLGFDAILVAASVTTAIFALRRDPAMHYPALITAVLLTVDTWFDVTTAAPGAPFRHAMILAVTCEIPLALFAGWLAIRTGRRYRNRHPDLRLQGPPAGTS